MNDEVLVFQFKEYLAVRRYAHTTIVLYAREAKTFLTFAHSLGLTSVAELARPHLEQYRVVLFYRKGMPKTKSVGQSLAASTQCLRLAAVVKFISFLVHSDYLLLDIGAGFEYPKVPDTLPREVLSERETLKLLTTPDVSNPMGVRDRSVLELLYGTGIRNTELRDLTLAHLDFSRHLVRVLGKGEKERMVPLGEEAEIWLEEYLTSVRPLMVRNPQAPWLFLSVRGCQLEAGVLIRIVTQAAKKAQLTKHVTPHILRHSCATHMLSRGADLRYIQALLGHSTPVTTQLYTRVEITALRKVILRCHPRERKS